MVSMGQQSLVDEAIQTGAGLHSKTIQAQQVIETVKIFLVNNIYEYRFICL